MDEKEGLGRSHRSCIKLSKDVRSRTKGIELYKLFTSLGYLAVRGSSWRGYTGTRTFPELVGRPIQNLVAIGLSVCV